MPGSKYKIVRKCPVCGEEFFARTLESWYCSPKCSKVAWKRKHDEEKRQLELDSIAKSIPNYRDYITITEAYALFGISRDSIYRLIKLNRISSIKRKGAKIKVSKTELMKLYPLRQSPLDTNPRKPVTMYRMEPEDCYTIGEISKKFHLDDSTVYAHIRKYSIPTRQIGNYVYAHKESIDKLYKDIHALVWEWFIYLEAYPVYETGSDKPKRVREYLRRSITTPIWDKRRSERAVAGRIKYKPKRDDNGVIQCKSKQDMETCLYADGVRVLRQKEYDNMALFTEQQMEMAEQSERSKCNVLEYIEKLIKEREETASESIVVNWRRLHTLLSMFAKCDYIQFSQIDMKYIEAFRSFLIKAPQGGSKKGTISRNTASTYFSIFKAALKQAFVDGYLNCDIAAKAKNIMFQSARREYLSLEELNILAKTPCDDILKRAALFSALTGMRHSDIQKLKWSEVEEYNGGYRLNFTQQKTKGVEYMPISPQAYKLCGERKKDGELLVFAGLPDPSWISKPLERWVKASGITKHITFHCFRHTYATLQLANGTDIYTVSKMLGHTNVKTTQIYAKVIDKKKDEATEAFKLDIDE